MKTSRSKRFSGLISLETKRLVLEPLVPAHAAVLFPYLRDPRLYEFLDSEPPKSIAILESQYRKWESRRSPDGSQHWLNWVARLRDGAFVGWIQVTVRSDASADLAYLVFRPHQRQGYALESCRAIIDHVREEHSVRTVCATIEAANTASIALAHGLGLKHAGQDGRGCLFESQN